MTTSTLTPVQGILDSPAMKFLAGFCYTQLTDIEQEINGLLTFDRQPKVPAEAIAEIHRELFKAFEAGRRT